MVSSIKEIVNFLKKQNFLVKALLSVMMEEVFSTRDHVGPIPLHGEERIKQLC